MVLNIQNFDFYGKISAYRIIDNNTSDTKQILIEIRKNGYLEYQCIYNKRIENNLVTIDGIKPLSEDEVKEIMKFISYDKNALALFKEYLNELHRINTSDSKVGLSQDVEIKVFEITQEKEELITNPGLGPVKKFYYKQDRLNRYIGIVTDSDLQLIYMSLYSLINGQLVLDAEIKRKLTDEESECIKTFISGNKDALNIFNEYLSKIQNKTR